MNQLKNTLKQLHRTANYFNETERSEYIRMDGNENVDGLPEEFIREVLSEIHAADLAAYPNPRKCMEAIADYLGFDRACVFVTNGSDAAIKMFFEIYIEEGDEVLMTSPTFEMYGVYCSMFGAEAVTTRYEDDLVFPYDKYVENLNRNIKAAIITNPDNPTGAVLSLDKITEIVRIAHERDILVVIDEAYYWLYHETAIDLIREYNNVIILRTFSKLMGLAGMRLGFLASNAEIVSDFKKVAPPAGVNTIALKFGEKIMRRPDMIKEWIEQYQAEKQYMCDALCRNKIPFIKTESNYVLIPISQDPGHVLAEFKARGILVAYKMNKYLRANVGGRVAVDRFVQAYLEICG